MINITPVAYIHVEYLATDRQTNNLTEPETRHHGTNVKKTTSIPESTTAATGPELGCTADDDDDDVDDEFSSSLTAAAARTDVAVCVAADMSTGAASVMPTLCMLSLTLPAAADATMAPTLTRGVVTVLSTSVRIVSDISATFTAAMFVHCII